MMKNVRESLAGRIGILQLFSLSKNEVDNVVFENSLDFSFNCLKQREVKSKKCDIHDIYEHIWRGGMPQVQKASNSMRGEFYNSYIDTYLMRDIAELGGITDSLRFRRFLIACASLVSEQLNYKTLADVAEISQPTAKNWITLIEGLGIIYLLKPYANNHLKRLTKTAKLYFCDTGLCAYLSMWPSKETLMNGATSGHYFENYVVMELLKNYSYSGQRVNLSYYRDSNIKEIDVFVELNNQISPLEIKKSANPDRRDIKKFEVIEKTGIPQGYGGITCMCEKVIPINGKILLYHAYCCK